MSTKNPYDVEADGCQCSAWSEGECGCGRYVDPAWKRIWQRGYEAGYGDALSKPEVDAERRKAAVAALVDAAHDWAGGEWRAVNFNRAGRDEHPGMRQARWMRDRAQRIEATPADTAPMRAQSNEPEGASE